MFNQYDVVDVVDFARNAQCRYCGDMMTLKSILAKMYTGLDEDGVVIALFDVAYEMGRRKAAQEAIEPPKPEKIILVMDSREVAQIMGKRHDHLIRDIETYCNYLENCIDPKIGVNEFYIENCYQDKIGRTLKRYDITKKGCEMIAHKMTGQKGVTFTAAYINRFHEMEGLLEGEEGARPQPRPTGPKTAALLMNAQARQLTAVTQAAKAGIIPREEAKHYLKSSK